MYSPHFYSLGCILRLHYWKIHRRGSPTKSSKEITTTTTWWYPITYKNTSNYAPKTSTLGETNNPYIYLLNPEYLTGTLFRVINSTETLSTKLVRHILIFPEYILCFSLSNSINISPLLYRVPNKQRIYYIIFLLGE